jgi:beta-glucanase (GH16 family)/predicted esterase
MKTRTIALAILVALVALAPLASAQTPQRISLWPNGAPGSEARRGEAELAADYWVRNVHDPSVTVFLPPKERATGAGVVVCPGGGHRLLVYNSEGVEAARFLNGLGVAAFVLKYRLGREEGSPYTIERDAKADGLRAMRVVRSRAAEWGLDPNRIGIMGFSAGGEVVSMVSYADGAGDLEAADPVERVSARPSFQILVYPGPLGIPAALPSSSPPAFLVAANDDECCSAPVVELLEKLRAAKVPVEVHLFARGGHAFNMGLRSDLVTLKDWPRRLEAWMRDNAILAPSPAPAAASESSRDDREWRLVWSDEFDHDGRPDPRNWTYERGFVRNEEAQYYRSENAWCEGGHLVVEARRERVPNERFAKGSGDWRTNRETADYTSASLTTRGLHAWRYGRFEMRGKIDTRPGMWPAFWTLGATGEWPSGGEIDIMEYYRGMLLANVAWGSGEPYVAVWDTTKTPLADLGGPAWADEFHTWRMDWDEREIRLSVDGRLLNTTSLAETVNRGGDGSNPFHRAQFVILNLAIGGTQGGDPAETRFPARFEVDYVRVFQKN